MLINKRDGPGEGVYEVYCRMDSMEGTGRIHLVIGWGLVGSKGSRIETK